VYPSVKGEANCAQPVAVWAALQALLAGATLAVAAIIRKETPEWGKVIKDAGIKLGN
jgi:hypothetical protein